MHLILFVDIFNLLSKAHIQTGLCYSLYQFFPFREVTLPHIIPVSLSLDNTAKRPTGLIT